MEFEKLSQEKPKCPSCKKELINGVCKNQQDVYGFNTDFSKYFKKQGMIESKVEKPKTEEPFIMPGTGVKEVLGGGFEDVKGVHMPMPGEEELEEAKIIEEPTPEKNNHQSL